VDLGLELEMTLQQGPCTFGFSGEIWTKAGIAQVIRQEFGVSYHPTQVGGRSMNGASVGKSQP